MNERKMASVQKIIDIIPIEGADKICSYKVLGWNVIDSIGKYNIGDYVVYCEIDSWIPNSICPFLSKGNEPKEYNDIKGERLRTVRLKGTLSQGLILPYNTIMSNYEGECNSTDWFEGDDVSDILGIIKYEPPIPAALAGEIKSIFPSYIPKTDQERIQNLSIDIDKFKQLDWEVTEKLDGSSCTIYHNNEDFGVCSRNLDLKPSDSNTFWKMAVFHDLETKLKALNKNIAIQGEVIGEGIQGNPYKIKGQKFFVFDMFDIDNQCYYTNTNREQLAEILNLNHVPIIKDEITFTVDDLLKNAEGKSVVNLSTEREGLVFKCISDPSISFKAISNKFLLKHQN